MVSAATAPIRRPATVEPVSETMSTSGCATSVSPTPAPVPVTRLNTPGGRPIESNTSANTYAFNGATSLGLRTTVHPAPRAGATFAAIWCNG